MGRIVPEDRVLIRSVADSLVVAADPEAVHAAKSYWVRSRPWVLPVVDALGSLADEEVSIAGKRLMADSKSRAPYVRLCRELNRAVARNAPGLAELLELAWRAECNSRIGYHIGARYEPNRAQGVSTDELSMARARWKCADDSAMLIVIPFRDSSTDALRTRNVMACLRALQDQSADRKDYCIVVVESDEKPRWQHILASLCDQYIFAPGSGPFNKSWATNVGVRNSDGDHDVVCVLDADALPDRHFVQRNIARFRRAGTQALLPFREVLWLDSASTEIALDSRLRGDASSPDISLLRGFLLRCPPGLCIMVRSGIYASIGGMDERYEGWGGEDTDFALRVAANAALDRYDDLGLHMYHPPSPVRTLDNRPVNAGIPPISWPRNAKFGLLARTGECE